VYIYIYIYIYIYVCIYLLLLLGSELPLMVESFGLLNDIFPFPSILDEDYPVFNLRLANILFDIILPSILGFITRILLYSLSSASIKSSGSISSFRVFSLQLFYMEG